MKKYYERKKMESNQTPVFVPGIECKQCHATMDPIEEHWQKDPKSKTGFRQPCKYCIKLNRKAKSPRNEAAKA